MIYRTFRKEEYKRRKIEFNTYKHNTQGYRVRGIIDSGKLIGGSAGIFEGRTKEEVFNKIKNFIDNVEIQERNVRFAIERLFFYSIIKNIKGEKGRNVTAYVYERIITYDSDRRVHGMTKIGQVKWQTGSLYYDSEKTSVLNFLKRKGKVHRDMFPNKGEYKDSEANYYNIKIVKD